MILPQTYSLVWLLMAFSLICWGSWANTYKLAGKFRFEVYYLDFAIGCLAIAILYAFTVGNLGFDSFSFIDDLEHAGKREWLYAFTAGVIFNLGNMLLTAAVSVGGMAVAFPVGIGMALILGSLLAFFTRPAGNLLLLVFGCVLIVAAIVAIGFANHILGVIHHEQMARAGKAKSTRRPLTIKAVILALAGGVLLGCYSPLVAKAMEGEIGVGPYAAMVLFSLGIFGSTFVYEIFFINLPVEGEPLEITEFLRGKPKQHLWGLLGGIIWCSGAVASLAAGYSPVKAAHLGPSLNALLAMGYPLIAALWGLLAWKEFKDGDMRVRLCAILMLILFAGGMVLMAVAPFQVQRA